MKRYVLFTIIICMLLGFTGCSSPKKPNPIDEGKTALAAGDYDKALGSFRVAINEGVADESVKKMEEMIVKYLKAKKDYTEGKIEEAKSTLDSLSPEYANYSIKSDVDTLKVDVEAKFKGIEEAKAKEEAEHKKVVSEQAKKNDSASKKQYYIKKLKSVEVGLKDLEHKLQGSTVDMKEGLSEENARWDKVLNEIYQDLKKTLPASQFQNLQKEQREWIKTRDKKADNAAKEFEGGTFAGVAYIDSLASSTKARCYQLVEFF